MKNETLMNYYEYAKAIKLGQDKEIARVIYGCPDGISAKYKKEVNQMLLSHKAII